MDLNTCDRFLEEDCHYQGELILNTDDIADAKHCQILCQLITEPSRCNYWVFQENEEGKNDCSLLASGDRSCTMIGGPRDPNLKECAPTTTTTTTTTPTTTLTTPQCSKTQLTIEETMPLENTFGNESYCQAVSCSICSCENWEFNDLKTLAIQHSNTNIANIGLGSEYVLGVNFNGTFNTSSEIDDDYIGFVFGFQDPSYFYVVYASKFNASNNFMTNYQFRITQVNSITGLNGPDMRLAILNETSSIPNQTEILWQDKVDRGWLPNKEYTWNLKIRPLNGQLRLELFEDSVPLFDTGILNSNITQGRLGVFSLSQPETFWYDMWYECDNQPLI